MPSHLTQPTRQTSSNGRRSHRSPGGLPSQNARLTHDRLVCTTLRTYPITRRAPVMHAPHVPRRAISPVAPTPRFVPLLKPYELTLDRCRPVPAAPVPTPVPVPDRTSTGNHTPEFAALCTHSVSHTQSHRESQGKDTHIL